MKLKKLINFLVIVDYFLLRLNLSKVKKINAKKIVRKFYLYTKEKWRMKSKKI